MRRSSIIEARRQSVNPEARRTVEFSFQIVDRIYDILEAKGMKLEDLAMLLDKKEEEINKWMRGTYCFTTDTIMMIEEALGMPILGVQQHRRHHVESAMA